MAVTLPLSKLLQGARSRAFVRTKVPYKQLAVAHSVHTLRASTPQDNLFKSPISPRYHRFFTSVNLEIDGSRFPYFPIDYAEQITRYEPHGYHPVHLGDSFNDGRYTVVNKLGHGDSATVWLAKDASTRKFVALKILVGSESGSSVEIGLSSMLHKDTGLGQRSIMIPSDVFQISGPNGMHSCLVLPVTGPSIAHYANSAVPCYLPLKLAKRATWYTVKGVEYLHRNGIGHGDLRSENVLLEIPTLGSWNENQILARFGEPFRQDIKRTNGLPLKTALDPCPEIPSYAVSVLPCSTSESYILDGSIKVADFGSAYLTGEPKPKSRTECRPGTYAPERLLGHPFDLPSDIWSLGCTIFAIMSGLELFESMGSLGGRVSTMRDILQTLGKPSGPWWTQWQESEKSRGVTNHEIQQHSHVLQSLTDIVKEIRSGDFDEEAVSGLMPVRTQDMTLEDIEGMTDLLGRMLVYKPERRLTASQVLAHPWVKSLEAEIRVI